MANWPSNGETDWNTKMAEYVAVEHNTDGTHNIDGAVVQVVNTTSYSEVSITNTKKTYTTTMASTEGNECMSLAITPQKTTNYLRVDVTANFSSAGSYQPYMAGIFRDSDTNAVACAPAITSVANFPSTVTFTYYVAAGSTSETTFKVYMARGNTSYACKFNNSSYNFGNKIVSSITITEIQA